ncbi:unnamed protein product [Microthlaspi erraticum]|uniref:GRF-type domain-containing protein n=1 Tax=Microthlaspi erraticum TaxID=1685480 RepID=A0A6D2IHZ8_9BRAS|nr:unnamed protein product [Microthlaspi erraticum]
MGRFSWCTEGSSSSVRLWSDDAAEVSSHTTRPISFGIPSRCYCGLLTLLKMMDRADEYPGRMFFGCKDYKLGPPHLVKWWDEAMMEEFEEVRLTRENPQARIIEAQNADREDLTRNEAEIVQLKAQLLGTRRRRRVEVTTLGMVVVVLVCLISYSLL